MLFVVVLAFSLLMIVSVDIVKSLIKPFMHGIEFLSNFMDLFTGQKVGCCLLDSLKNRYAMHTCG